MNQDQSPLLRAPPRLRRRGRAAGFTLMEILLALALIALLVSVMIPISVNLIGNHATSADDVFWKAAREARKAALKGEHDTVLAYDGRSRAFVLTDINEVQTFPLETKQDVTIDFLPGQVRAGTALIGGQMVDTQTIPSVSFFADGTCIPFRVQFRVGADSHIVGIDPWTCAPVLPEVKPE